MAKRKRQLAHFPEKYQEIARAVGLGQTAVLHAGDHKEARSIYFEFIAWRAVLRREAKEREDLQELLTLAESVISSHTIGDTVIYFRHRELSDRAKRLDTVAFFPTLEAAKEAARGTPDKE